MMSRRLILLGFVPTIDHIKYKQVKKQSFHINLYNYLH